VKISKIKIKGFGKFQNTEFSFQKGMNVLYGQNESGKTTLANFILYTISGFSSEEIAKYTPWNSEDFGGEMLVETQNGEIRQELDPNDPSYEKIVRREEYESSSFISEEGGLIVSKGVSGIVIAKLRKRMEEIERMERVIDLLKNEQSVYEKLSQVEKELAQKIRKTEEKINLLNEKLSEEKTLRKRYVESKKKLNYLRKELNALENKLLSAKIIKSKNIWKEMDEIRLKISSLGVEISNLKKYMKYPQEKIERVWELKREIREIEEKIDKISAELDSRLEEEKILGERKKVLEELLRISENDDVDKIILKVKNIELSLKMLEEKKRPKGYDERWKYFERIIDADKRISELSSMLEKIKTLEKNLNEIEKELEVVDKELSAIRAKINLRNTLTIVFLALAGGLIGAGYLSNLLFFLSISAAVSTGLSLALFLSTSELRKNRASLEGEKERLNLNYKVLEKKLENLKNEVSSMISGTDFKSPQELIDEYRRYQNWKKSMESHIENESVKVLEREIVESLKEFFDEVKGDYSKLVSEIKDKVSEYAILRDKMASLKLSIDGLKTVLEDLKKKREELLNEKDSIFKELGCSSYEDCKKLVENRKKYEVLIEEREGLENRLKELKNEWEEFKSYYDMAIPEGIDVEKLESIEVLSTRIENTKIEISDLENRINQLLNDIEKIKVDPSEILKTKSELVEAKLNHKLAEEELKIFPEVVKLFSMIKDEFVEKYKEIFEKKFREYSERIIGRDFETSVGDDLSISIKVSGLESLSRATKDQVELAYKLALYDVLSPKDPYPFVIDNAFTRYDDLRLETVLSLLKEIAKNRQVILTTSDTRVLNLVPKRSVKELQSP